MSASNIAEKQIRSDENREGRGRAHAQRYGRLIERIGSQYLVPSSNTNSAAKYLVDLVAPSCTCADFELRRAKCLHVHSVEFLIAWEGVVDDTVVPPKKVRPTYAQNWPAYNAAQVNERAHVEQLLRALCDEIPSPAKKRGRPRLPESARVFGAVWKVYSTKSGRRAHAEMRGVCDRGLVGVLPSYNSIFKALDDPTLIPILKSMIVESALPMRELERQFAQDATGFSFTTYERYLDYRQDRERLRKSFVKLHAFVGTRTHIITQVEINERGDCPMLPGMLKATVDAGFHVEEVSADKAYLSYANVAAIRAAGATAFIPFKSSSIGKGSSTMREMLAFYLMKNAEFFDHYHRRSNVETSFSMMKRKFGAGVRSKNRVARINELLAKVLLHNLCCLVSAFYETGLSPPFLQGPVPTEGVSPEPEPVASVTRLKPVLKLVPNE